MLIMFSLTSIIIITVTIHKGQFPNICLNSDIYFLQKKACQLVPSIFSENVLIFFNNFNYIAEFRSINPIILSKKVAISPYVFYFQNTAMAALGLQ